MPTAWRGEGVSVRDLERRLAELEHGHGSNETDIRTSVLTHVAWVPPDWERAAQDVLEGLGDRHPSRAILLLPSPNGAGDRIDARLELRCACPAGYAQHLCSELIELRLHGRRGVAPASVVAPLLIPDLPAFLRWRGRPPFGDQGFEGMVDLVDRVIVDSSEWPDVPEAYGPWAALFERGVCSDIAWRRTRRWRLALARLWPGIAELEELRIRGPLADALLLHGWLRSRLGRALALAHDPGERLAGIEVDGEEVPPPTDPEPSPSDLLSEELDELARDPVYERAVTTVAAS